MRPQRLGNAGLFDTLLLQQHQFGDVIDVVHDVSERAVRLQDRGVNGIPVTRLPAAALSFRLANVMPLQPHHVSDVGLQHSTKGSG